MATRSAPRRKKRAKAGAGAGRGREVEVKNANVAKIGKERKVKAGKGNEVAVKNEDEVGQEAEIVITDLKAATGARILDLQNLTVGSEGRLDCHTSN